MQAFVSSLMIFWDGRIRYLRQLPHQGTLKAAVGAAAANAPVVRILPVRSSRSEVPLFTSTTETQNFPSLLL